MWNNEMVVELNEFGLALVFTVEDTNVPEIQVNAGAEASAVTITEEKVFGNSLNVAKSPGPDVLKYIAAEIVEALEVIFQESQESGMVSEH